MPFGAGATFCCRCRCRCQWEPSGAIRSWQGAAGKVLLLHLDAPVASLGPPCAALGAHGRRWCAGTHDGAALPCTPPRPNLNGRAHHCGGPTCSLLDQGTGEGHKRVLQVPSTLQWLTCGLAHQPILAPLRCISPSWAVIPSPAARGPPVGHPCSCHAHSLLFPVSENASGSTLAALQVKNDPEILKREPLAWPGQQGL